MKKQCKAYGSKQHWYLSDGRYKCRICGIRCSWQSVWSASRLSNASKRKLLERFVLGRLILQKYFHLYSGEICYRFNHRTEDLYPLIYKLLRQTDMDEMKPILVRIR